MAASTTISVRKILFMVGLLFTGDESPRRELAGRIPGWRLYEINVFGTPSKGQPFPEEHDAEILNDIGDRPSARGENRSNLSTVADRQSGIFERYHRGHL